LGNRGGLFATQERLERLVLLGAVLLDGPRLPSSPYGDGAAAVRGDVDGAAPDVVGLADGEEPGFTSGGRRWLATMRPGSPGTGTSLSVP